MAGAVVLENVYKVFFLFCSSKRTEVDPRYHATTSECKCQLLKNLIQTSKNIFEIFIFVVCFLISQILFMAPNILEMTKALCLMEISSLTPQT